MTLPRSYLADATSTLGRRGLRGEKIWQAHREHFYQLAVRNGLSHAQVVRHVLLVDLALVGLAMAAAKGFVWVSLIAAMACVGWLLFTLSGGRSR